MKVTLRIRGRTRSFSKQELTAIVEKYFSGGTTKKIKVRIVPQRPTNGVWYGVYPETIDQRLFTEKRLDRNQEEARKIIVKAFYELNNNPEKYGRPFETFMPKNSGKNKITPEIEESAKDYGGHMATWKEQAFEWAQRIHNGESWEDVCNKPDTALWVRAVKWEDGKVHLVGGRLGATYVSDEFYSSACILSGIVPLVVRYK